MTTEELKNLIASKIAGQGSAVDAGSALPKILNGLVDAVVSATANGYKLLGCYHSYEMPDVPEDGQYFIFVYDGESESPNYSFYLSNNGEWEEVSDGTFKFYVYHSAQLISENADESDGYITPRGLVDYVASSDVLVLPTDAYTNVYGSYPTKAALAQQFGISESDVDGLLLGKYRIIKDNIDYSIWTYQGSVNKVAVFTTWVQDERKFIAIGSNNGTYYVSENV